MRQLLSLTFVLCALPAVALAQSASGTVSGRVVDDQGKAVPGATVFIENKITGYRHSVRTDAQGRYKLSNLPYNTYHLEVGAPGLNMAHQNLDVRSNLPIEVNLTLKPASAVVEVEESVSLIEVHTSSHIDIDQSTIEKIPTAVQSRGMENILLATPGFIQDENGRFHFRGSHGQVMYVVDGVPVTDQVQATFSNSMDPSQVESMEVITGGISAEFGGKPGAVVNLTSKSGLGPPMASKVMCPSGWPASTPAKLGFSVRGGGDTFGYFVTGAGSQSDRFLDPVNFDNLHNHGDTGRLFSRFDWVLSDHDTLRLSISGGQTKRDVVNLASQEPAGQNQRVENTDQQPEPGLDPPVQRHPEPGYEPLLPAQHVQAASRPRTWRLASPMAVPISPFWAKQDRSLDNQGLVTAYTQKDGGQHVQDGVAVCPLSHPRTLRLRDHRSRPRSRTRVIPSIPYIPGRWREHLPFRRRHHAHPGLRLHPGRPEGGQLEPGPGPALRQLPWPQLHQNQLQPRLGSPTTSQPRAPCSGSVYDRLMITPENEGLAALDLPAGLDGDLGPEHPRGPAAAGAPGQLPRRRRAAVGEGRQGEPGILVEGQHQRGRQLPVPEHGRAVPHRRGQGQVPRPGSPRSM